MAGLKFSPDLFLEVAELNRLKQGLDDNGFRKNVLDNSTAFGLIKNSNNIAFPNGRVQRDADTSLSQRTIKIAELFGVDKNGNFLHLPPTAQIPVPTDGNWYWVKVSYAVSTLEIGTFSISGNGDLVDTSGNSVLTQIFRGMPNFPTRISFPSSQYNTLEYDVLEVIDDQHATVQHPATNAYGVSEFVPETGLTMQIVGTFTQGIAVPSGSKNPFLYDSATASIVVETVLNTRPAYTTGQDFYIARVQATLSTVIVQDKRGEYWETKGSSINTEINRTANPLIGVESVQYNSAASPLDENIVKVAWGMRTANWSIDSTNNIATFTSGNGGKYKSVANFTNGDFDGWRLYTPTGKYHRIVSSVQSGGAINCTLDNLDIDNFSNDGGVTFTVGNILAVPDCEQVEILFTPDPGDTVSAFKKSFLFPVNQLVGRCDVLAYKDPNCLYNVQYRYKTIKEFTAYQPIPSDVAHGYYTEASFDASGNVVVSPTYLTYTSNATAGFIQLNMSASAISKFRYKVDKGDIIGVNSITSFTGFTAITFVVGTDKNYQYINGTLSLANDIYLSISKAGAIEGNEFRFHFNPSAIAMNGHSIFIVQDFGLVDQMTIKQLQQGDIYQMFNQDNGVVFDCKYNGSQWLGYQNYNLGQPFETTMYDGSITGVFDPTTKMGITKGWYGWQLHTVLNAGLTPVGFGSRTETYTNGNTVTKAFNITDTGGEMAHQNTDAETASHSHAPGTLPARGNRKNGDDSGGQQMWQMNSSDSTTGGSGFPVNNGDADRGITKAQWTAPEGGDQQHNNMQPYYVLAFVKKQF